jgi:uncharacterized protein (TIGR02996 family)
MNPRTFVFSDDKSHKFWSVELQGVAFTVRFGRVGTPGQAQEKRFTDEAKAKKECDKLVAEKVKKGYVETTPSAASALAPVSTLRDALEAAIVANPDDRAAHSAYADWLTEQSDKADVALGEFMQVQIALEAPSRPAAERAALQKKEKALLKKHRREWEGEWPDLTPYGGPEGRGQLDFPEPRPLRFIRGLPAEAVIGEFKVDSARAFVRSPQTRFLRKLFVGGYAYEADGEYEPGEDTARDAPYDEPSGSVLADWPHFANLRVFQLGWTSDEVYDDFCNFQCHLGGDHVHEEVRKMPHLEELYVFAHGVDGHKLFALPLPNLRVLQLYHSAQYPLEKLAKNATLGRLTHLLCHPHALEVDEPYITLKGLKALARSPHLTSLTHLRLRLTVFGDDGVKEIVQSGLLKRLKMLDLRHGRVTDKGAKLLAGCLETRNLEGLDLSRNELTDEGINALQATGVPLQAGHQHGSTADVDPDDLYQLEFLMEGDYE